MATESTDNIRKKNLYDILGIPSTATQKEIHKAYKDLALICHPDKNPDNIDNATKNFQELGNAFNILYSPTKRDRYDCSIRTVRNEYTFCPFNGIICNKCQYSINRPDSKNAEKLTDFAKIGRHEKQTHNAKKDEIEERENLVHRYKTEMDAKVEIIKRLLLLEKYDEAYAMFFAWVGEKGKYPFCTQCKKLVFSKNGHKSHHRKFCAGKPKFFQEGIASTNCTKNESRILLVEDFNFFNEKYENIYFFKQLYTAMSDDTSEDNQDDVSNTSNANIDNTNNGQNDDDNNSVSTISPRRRF
jgi:curved DNA-binding protein CbpA